MQKGQAIDSIGDSGPLLDPTLQFPGVDGMSFNLALDAQDMEWLSNIPFDPNIDIEPSTAEWFDGFSADDDTFLTT